ncbi:MAG: HEAT repeat domain-containing protein [Verrucomicrobiia bacterium]
MSRLFLFLVVLVLAGCGNAKEKKIISDVETLMKFHEYSKAMMVLKEALKEEPKNKKFLRYRILILLKAEQPDLAYAAYRQMKEKISSGDDVLLKALENEDVTIRVTAAQVLSVAKEPESVPALIKRVSDSDETVRRAAINALRELKDSRATKVLQKALKDESWFVRGEAAQALSAIGAEEALPDLFDALHDSDAYVKQAAGAALIALANGDNLEIFSQQLSHDDWERN